jgi:hypothetical protein
MAAAANWMTFAVGHVRLHALLLAVFPCFVAYQLLHGHVAGLKGKLRFTAWRCPRDQHS